MARRKKYRSKIQITFEHLAKYLLLTDEVRVRDVYTDPNRDIVTFMLEGDGYLTSPESGIRLFEIGEGQEVPNQIPTEASRIEAMKRYIAKYEEQLAAQQLKDATDEIRKHFEKVKRDA